MNERGVLNIYEVAAFIGLILVAFIIFMFFILAQDSLKNKFDEGDFSAKFSANQGDLFVDAYLLTPLNASASIYGSSVVLPAVDSTVGEALPPLLNDPRCAAWLAKNGAYDTKTFALLQPPTQACGAFLERTALFLESACDPQYATITVTGKATVTVGHWPSDLKQLAQRLGLASSVAANLASQAGPNPLSTTFAPTLVLGLAASDLTPPFVSGTGYLASTEGPITIQLNCVEKYGVNAK